MIHTQNSIYRDTCKDEDVQLKEYLGFLYAHGYWDSLGTAGDVIFNCGKTFSDSNEFPQLSGISEIHLTVKMGQIQSITYFPRFA